MMRKEMNEKTKTITVTSMQKKINLKKSNGIRKKRMSKMMMKRNFAGMMVEDEIF
jgi:hypothetical protein